MILIIDNYDSFTFNLVQYLGELGADLKVIRNDKIKVEEALALKPEKLLISLVHVLQLKQVFHVT